MSEREQRPKDSRSKPTSDVLDDLQHGDIHGAFGTIRVSDVTPRRTWRRRLLTLAAIIGPGLIVMVGDNDAGGVATYAQAGQDFGYSLLWTLILLIPVLIVNQEMVVRLGAVTGVGYAKLISERFGRFWGWYSVAGIFLLNFLTISTEFMGISLAGEYFRLSPVLVVPIAAALLIGITVSGRNADSYRVSISDKGMSYEPGEVDDLPTVIDFDAGGMVLTAFGRINGGNARGDQALAERFLNLFYRI